MGVGTTAAYAVPDSSAVVIGGHQIKDNLLEFDLKKGVLRKTGLISSNSTTTMSRYSSTSPSNS
jgi:hypothetical protein